MQIIEGRIKRKMRAVIYGPEGIGKSTTASAFPRPVFIDVEGGTHHLDVARIEAPKSWAALMLILDNFASGNIPADYETLVVDTVDWAEKMLREDICAQAGVTALGDRPYGTLYQQLGAKWGQFLDKLAFISEKMHVVLLAHSQLSRCEIPEEHGSFDRYELKLNTGFKINTASMTKEWASLVMFLNYETIVVQGENGKPKAQGGQRVAYTSHHSCWDAKNRYGLPEKLKMPMNGMPPELAAVIKSLDGDAPARPQQTTTATPALEQPQPQPAIPAAPQIPAIPAAPAEEAPLSENTQEKDGLLRQLGELMNISKITFPMLDWELSRKGIVPPGTNPRNFNIPTLRRIIGGWEAITNNIRYNYKGTTA